MKKNTKRRVANNLRLTACALTACLLANAAAPTAAALEATHSEALYVTLDAYGVPTESSIVKSYSRNGAASITDYGDYDEVVNMSDESTPARTDGKVVWNFAEDAPNRFYFEGKTAAPVSELPWSIAVSYKLNGVPKEAKELAGEQGLVEITINVTPNPASPEYFQNNMILQAATVVDADDVLSVEAPGAQVQSIGSMTAIVFMALPGEADTFTLRIGSDDFSFAGLYFLMIPATLQQLDQIADLREAKEKIEDSGNALSDSLDVVLGTMGAMEGSINATANGLNLLDDARKTISSGKGPVYASADGALADLDTVADALQPVSGHLAQAQSALTDTKNQLDAMVKTALTLKEQTAQTRNVIEKTQKDIEGVKAMLADLKKQGTYRRDTIDSLLDDIDAMQWDMELLSGNLKDLQNALAKQKGISTVDSIDIDELVGAQEVPNTGLTVKQVLAKLDTLQAAYDQVPAQAGALDTEQFIGYLVTNGLLDAAEADGAKYLWGNKNDIRQQINDAKNAIADEIGMVNQALPFVNSKITEINKLLKGIASPTGDVIGSLANVCERLGDDDDDSILNELWELCDLVDGYLNAFDKHNGDMSDLTDQLNQAGSIASTATEKLDTLLDDLDGLNKILDTYEPEAQAALEDAKTLTSAAASGIVNADNFLRSLKTLMQKSGKQLDAGSKDTLQGMADALRRAAEGLGQTNVIQNAKDTVKDLIDDEWDSHTGEDNNLLNMDAEAVPVSFTSSLNPAPTSLQIILRTESITPDDDDKTAEQDENFHAEGNFFSRLWNVIKEIGRAISSLFP